jgi:hypothetical protein
MEEGGKWRSALGGLEAGVLGALGMLAVFVVSAIVGRRSWWLVPNLVATAFHGANAYTASLTRSTLTGVGFWLLLYGFLGVVWGLLWGDRPVRRLWMGGAVTGYLVYLAFRAVLWKSIAPLVSLYAPELQFKIAHLVWGIALGQSPRYAASIGRTMTPEEEVPPPLPPLPPREEPPPLPETIF